MQVFEETNSKTDKVFVMLERQEASLIVDALEIISKQFPKKKKLKQLSKDLLESIPYEKTDLYLK